MLRAEVLKNMYFCGRISGMLILFTLILKFTLSDCSVVNTKSGPVQGLPSLKKDVEAFLGIPYAQPPVGELRFAKPVPVKRWYDVFKAFTLPPPCIQPKIRIYYFSPDLTNMSEDCLHLNVWKPRTREDENHEPWPIIIYFHHGGFVTGSSNQKIHDGSHLASRGKVIVVTVNFRVGVLGYFLAHTEEADGNMAMYDQLMAIKWVKENAELFGGDPENIVLMGSGSGAYQVSAHLASPLSRNLIKRAIFQGGSMINPFFANNDRLYKNSQAIAGLIGCTNDSTTLRTDPDSVIRCLKKAPAKAFSEAEGHMLKWTNPSTFFPRTLDQFLPKTFTELLNEGNVRSDVDILAGAAEEDGSVMTVIALSDYLGHYGEYTEKMSRTRASALVSGLVLLTKLVKPSKVVEPYLSHLKNHTAIGYTKMLANVVGDFTVACPTVLAADFVSRQENSVYFYKFGFRPPSTPMADWVGPSHLDDLPYVFGIPYHDNFTSEETELSERLIDYWTNFAKTGNPNIPGRVPWLRYHYDSPLYMYFGQDEESLRMKPFERCNIWPEIFNAKLDPESYLRFKSSGVNAVMHSLNFLSMFSLTVCVHLFVIPRC